MSPGSLLIRSYGGSDVGRRRQMNEDAFLCDDTLGLWLVADGMGGHAAGEVASQEAVDTIYGMVKRGKSRISDAIGKALASKEIAQAFANLGMVPKSNTPAELAALIKVEAATWGPIIRSTGFKPME